MEDAKYLDLMAKYLSGNLSGQEREEFLSWVAGSEANRQFFDEMIQLWSISGEFDEEPFTADLPQAWDRLAARLPEEQTPSSPEPPRQNDSSARIVRLSNRRRIASMAAVILVLIFAGWWWTKDPLGWRIVEWHTDAGERREIELPDGSRVWLNQFSTLAYRRPFRRRELTLDGEAFFDVERLESRPFTILSGEAKTRVLGTSFNVRAYSEESRIEVTVRTGVVQLSAREESAPKIELEAGDKGIFERESQQLTEVNEPDPNADAWKTRLLNFEGLPLREVIPALEHFYQIRIVVENEAILNCTVNGSYPDQALNEVLEIIDLMLLDVDIEQQNDSSFLFKGAGCS